MTHTSRNNTRMLAFTAIMAFPALAQATAYDAVTGFSKKQNPCAPWSYLAASKLLTHREVQAGDPQIHYWFNGKDMPNAALIGRNFGTKPYSSASAVIYPDYLDMDPENMSDTTVRFTAPLTGTYSFRGRFRGTDRQEASHPVAIVINGAVVLTNTINNFGQSIPFNGRASLQKGDTIDFINETSGSEVNLSTGLKVTIAGH